MYVYISQHSYEIDTFLECSTNIFLSVRLIKIDQYVLISVRHVRFYQPFVWVGGSIAIYTYAI